MSTLLEAAKELPIPERIKLVGDIWDSIAAEPKAVEISPEQKAELHHRVEYSRLNPEDVIPWELLKRKRWRANEAETETQSGSKAGISTTKRQIGITSKMKALK